MKWVELSVEAPPEYVEPLSQVFTRYGQGGVAIEHRRGDLADEGGQIPDDETVVLRTYFPLDDKAEERRGHIDLAVRLMAHIWPALSLREKVIEEEEWEHAWKEHFQILHIGKRVVVVPSWREYEPRETEVIVTLDPGMAFGTGQHPTTRTCLALLEDMVSPGMDILDVGCGSGILSIVAAKLGAGTVLGIDNDPVAGKVAQSNVIENGVASKARIVEGSLPSLVIKPDSYDIVVANISAKVISDLAGELGSVVREGGRLILSGFLADDEEAVAQRLLEAGCVVEVRHACGDWVSLVASPQR